MDVAQSEADESTNARSESARRPASHEPGRAVGSRVLVIGGAGTVGSVLCRQLVDSGYSVRILDAFAYGDEALADLVGDPRVEIVRGDTRDMEDVAAAMNDVRSVVHLGEIVGDPACALDPETTIDINIRASGNVARLARRLGVERFIYPSSCSVYGASDEIVNERSVLNPVSLYAEAKIAVEQDVLEMAGPTFHPVVLRFATVYGLSPRPRFDLVVNLLTAKAQSSGVITVNGGNQWRPFVHVSDAAAAIILCLRQSSVMISGEIFNVGSDEQNHTIGEIAEIIKNRVPGSRVVNGPAVDPRNYRVVFDKIRRQLGYLPAYALVDGIDQIRDALISGAVRDFTEARHSNVRALVETESGIRHMRMTERGWNRATTQAVVALTPEPVSRAS